MEDSEWVKNLGVAADIAQIVLGFASIIIFVWTTEWFFFGKRVRKVRRECDEISRILADAFEKDTYYAMLSAAEQIFGTEIDKLRKLYLKNKINERISLDLEIFEISKLKKQFETDYKEKSQQIIKLKECDRAFGGEEEGLSQSMKVDDQVKTSAEIEKELKEKQEEFKNDVISPSLQKVSYQMGVIREKLFSKLKL